MAGGVPGRLGSALGSCVRLLQVALDYTRAWDAVKNASRIADLKGVVLEVGTPLLKAEGVRIIRLLRALSAGPVVVADTKTVDAASVEVGLVASAGGDALTVLAVADDTVLRAAVEEAESRGVAVVGDMIGSRDVVQDAERLSRLGVHVALLHVGIDVQRRLGITAAKMPELIEKVAGAFGGPVAVAGGVRPEEAGMLAEAGASIVIIGGAIARAPDPREATARALQGIKPECR